MMGKIKSFEIELDNTSGIFHQGDVVSGKLILISEDDLKLRDITLEFNGAAKVHWTEKKGTSRSSHVVQYKAEEIYFEKQLSFLGSRGDKELTGLKAGRYEYLFSFKLPKSIPTSYESKIGHVRYSLKAFVDRPWAFETKTELLLTVLTPLDLNKRSDATKCAENEDMRILCCWCCKSEPIIGKVHVDRLGYVPGEEVRPKIECINKTNRKMTSIDLNLVQVILCHTKSKTKAIEHNVVQKSLGPLKKGRSLTVDGIRILVPSLPPSDLQFCSIIDIQYFIELLVCPRRPALSLQFRVPIVIGSIPLRSVTEGDKHEIVRTRSDLHATTITSSEEKTQVTPSYAQSGFGSSDRDDRSRHTPITALSKRSVSPQKSEMRWSPSYSYYHTETNGSYRIHDCQT